MAAEPIFSFDEREDGITQQAPVWVFLVGRHKSVVSRRMQFFRFRPSESSRFASVHLEPLMGVEPIYLSYQERPRPALRGIIVEAHPGFEPGHHALQACDSP